MRNNGILGVTSILICSSTVFNGARGHTHPDGVYGRCPSGIWSGQSTSIGTSRGGMYLDTPGRGECSVAIGCHGGKNKEMRK